jgi:hypothetical protein
VEELALNDPQESAAFCDLRVLDPDRGLQRRPLASTGDYG